MKLDMKSVRALARIMNETGISELEIKEGDSSLRLSRAPGAPQAVAMPQANANVAQAAPALPAASDAVVDFNKITELKSPMVGVFYVAPSPEAKPYVQVGDRVKKGDVLCLIEAMKVMNEITAETDGEIVDICAQNGQLVEFGQVLFKVF